VRGSTQQANLDELFAQAEFDRRLFALRAAHPHLAYELDEIARAFRRARDRVATVLRERVEPAEDAASP
jgi:hypothetical protein